MDSLLKDALEVNSPMALLEASIASILKQFHLFIQRRRFTSIREQQRSIGEVRRGIQDTSKGCVRFQLGRVPRPFDMFLSWRLWQCSLLSSGTFIVDNGAPCGLGRPGKWMLTGGCVGFEFKVDVLSRRAGCRRRVPVCIG